MVLAPRAQLRRSGPEPVPRLGALEEPLAARQRPGLCAHAGLGPAAPAQVHPRAHHSRAPSGTAGSHASVVCFRRQCVPPLQHAC